MLRIDRQDIHPRERGFFWKGDRVPYGSIANWTGEEKKTPMIFLFRFRFGMDWPRFLFAKDRGRDPDEAASGRIGKASLPQDSRKALGEAIHSMELNQENFASLILWPSPMPSQAFRWKESLWPPMGVLKGIISFSHPYEKGKDETEKGGTPCSRESDRLKGTKYGERAFIQAGRRKATS